MNPDLQTLPRCRPSQCVPQLQTSNMLKLYVANAIRRQNRREIDEKKQDGKGRAGRGKQTGDTEGGREEETEGVGGAAMAMVVELLESGKP